MMDVCIYDDGQPERRPLFEELAELDGPGWCWVEGRGFYVRDDAGWWHEATDEEVAKIRNDPGAV